MEFENETSIPNRRIKYKDGKSNPGIATNFAKQFEKLTKWYQEFTGTNVKSEPITEEQLINLQDEAKKCYESEVASYNIRNSKTNSDYQWMKTVMSKGTMSDKIAAYTILIQDDPVYNLHTVRNIVNMVKTGKRNECNSVVNTLTDLFLSDILKPDGKLIPFNKQPLSALQELSSGNAVKRRRILCHWYFEDELKNIYASFVQSLNAMAKDSVDANRECALGAMQNLLIGNPEHEKQILEQMVNKLGDPSKKVASKAMHCLEKVLSEHSNMQAVVLIEVEKLIFRQNVSTRTQYYGLCFLARFHLSVEEAQVAQKLVDVYFSFFKACIKKGEVDSRMMCALLVGVNRAYPFAQLESEKISSHVNTMYRVVHVSSFNVALHALGLLHRVDINTDRFYSALYKKLGDQELSNSTHHAIFLNLVFKALKNDKDTGRVKAFIKRLLQVSLSMQPTFICGTLFLISQLIRGNKILTAFMSEKFVLAEIKLELEDDEDTREEVYVDVKEDEDKEIEDTNIEKQLENENKNCNKTGQGWIHYDNEHVNDAIKIKNKKILSFSNEVENYNYFQRNPKFARGDKAVYSELLNLKYHYHPTVSLFASKILKRESIIYSGDPLKDFTLVRFLERFAFKNPKKIDVEKETKQDLTFAKRKLYKATGIRSLPVNSQNYLNSDEKKIPVDELFLYKFLKQRNMGKKDDEDDDNSSVASDEFHEMLDRMAGGKNMEDDDEDVDFMAEIGDNLKKASKIKKKREVDSDEEDVDDEEMDEDYGDDFDEENELGEDNEELENLNDDGDEDLDFDDDNDDLGDDDEEDIEFNDESDDEISYNKKGKNKKFDSKSLFASAEEFADLLEDEGASSVAPGGSNAMQNKDKADMKQISWEQKRNQWLKSYKGKGGSQGGSKFSKKRKNFSKPNNFKNKKMRK